MGGYNAECCTKSCARTTPPSYPIKKNIQWKKCESETKEVFKGYPWQPMRESMRPMRRRNDALYQIQRSEASIYATDFTGFSKTLRRPVDIADVVAPPEGKDLDPKSVYKTSYPRYNKKKMRECNPEPVIPLGSITVPPYHLTFKGKKSVTKSDYIRYRDPERRYEIPPRVTVNVYGSSLKTPKCMMPPPQFFEAPLPSPVEYGEYYNDAPVEPPAPDMLRVPESPVLEMPRVPASPVPEILRVPEPSAPEMPRIEEVSRAPSAGSAGESFTPEPRISTPPTQPKVQFEDSYREETNIPVQLDKEPIYSVPVRQTEPKMPARKELKHAPWRKEHKDFYSNGDVPQGKDFYRSLTCQWPKNAWNDELFKVINGGDTEMDRPESIILSTTMKDFQNPKNAKKTPPFVPVHNHQFGLPTKPEDYQTTFERTYRDWKEPKPEMPPWGRKAKFQQPTIPLPKDTTYKQYYKDPKVKEAPPSIPIRKTRIPYVEAAVGQPYELQTSYRHFYQPWVEYDRPVNCMEKKKFKPPTTPMPIVSCTQDDFRGEPMPRRELLKRMPLFQGFNIDPSLIRNTLYSDQYIDPRVKVGVDVPQETVFQPPGPQGPIPEAEAKLVLPKDEQSES